MIETITPSPTPLPAFVRFVVIPALVIAFLFAALVVYIIATAPAPSDASGNLLLQAQTERAIRSVMNDPESTRFYVVRQGKSPTIVCGRVNAKNGFGGYGEPRHFYSDSAPVRLEIEPRSDAELSAQPDFIKNWERACLK